MPTTNTPTSFPAGTVVFVPDGEPRRLRPNEWYEVKKYAGSGIARTAQSTVEKFQVYTRIDLSEPTHVVSGEMVDNFGNFIQNVRKLCRVARHVANGGGRDHANRDNIWTTAHDVEIAIPTFSHILTPAPVVKTPEKTVRERIVNKGHSITMMSDVLILADELDAQRAILNRIEARMKEGEKP